MTSRTQWIIRTLIAVGILSGVGFAALHHSSSPSADSGRTPVKQHRDNNGAELLVRAFEISDKDAASRVKNSFSGTVQPRYQTQMGFRVGGKITERLVEVGDRVQKGQVMFRLDPEDFDLQLRVAESELVASESQYRQAEAEEKRLSELRNSRSVSQSDYELVLATRDVTKARLEAAQRRLSMAKNQRQYCELASDQDGLVTKINAEVGQVVSAGQSVLVLMQGDELEVFVSVPEMAISEISKHHAEVSFWSQPGASVRAELRELSPVADSVSRTYDARFRFLEKTNNVSIGMTATVHSMRADYEGFAVPITAIAQKENAPIVWKIVGGNTKLQAVPVEILQYQADVCLIRAALQPGELIVSAGVQRVDENCTVRIWKDLR